MQQVEHRTVRQNSGRGRPSAYRSPAAIGRHADLSSPLPQFDAPSLDVIDPDRTLERLPRLSAHAVRRALPSPTPPPVTVSASSDLDLAVTVEIVPEIGEGDILEAAPAPRPPPPAYPPQAPFVPDCPPSSVPFDLSRAAASSTPFDLTRLLAQAQAEARKSPEYFHADPFPPRPVAPAMLPAAIPILAVDRTDPMVTIPFRGARQHLTWIAATVVAVALATFGIAVAQPHTAPSSAAAAAAARSPSARADAVVTRDVSVLSQASAWHSTSSATSSIGDVPSMSAQSLPQVEVGTISLAAVASSHRLFVDGHLAADGSAVVTCGAHTVRVGSRGATRHILVPCGQEVIVAN